MKNFMQEFKELDINELLNVNGGYGNSAYKSYSKEPVETWNPSSKNSPFADWINNKVPVDKEGNSPGYNLFNQKPGYGKYSLPTVSPSYNPPSKDSSKFNQLGFSEQYSAEFGEHACAATSLLNEISERYTMETGLPMTNAQAREAMAKAVGNNSILKNNAYVSDWTKAANTMWATTGLKGSFKYDESGNADHNIYAIDKNNDAEVDHFVNSTSNDSYYDPYSGTTGKVSDLTLQAGKNYRGFNFSK